jgi:hypothetical protein
MAQDRPAQAKPGPDQSEELKELVDEASEAYGAGEFETAVERLLAAYRIEPKARLLYNVARSYEELGQCRLALVYYRSFSQKDDAEKALVGKADEKLAGAEGCEAYSDELIGRLVVTTEPAGATVTVDGRDVGTTPVEIAGLPSGEHAISVELDGYKSASNTLDLKAGQDREVSARLVESSDTQAITSEDLTGDEVREPKTTAESNAGGVNIPAVALVGAGVVGLGVGTYFDLVAIPDTDDERSGYAADSQTYADLTETRESQVTGALVGYIGGGALLAAGTTWLLLDMTSESTDDSASLRPTAAPRKGGFVAGVEWTF